MFRMAHQLRRALCRNQVALFVHPAGGAHRPATRIRIYKCWRGNAERRLKSAGWSIVRPRCHARPKMAGPPFTICVARAVITNGSNRAASAVRNS